MCWKASCFKVISDYVLNEQLGREIEGGHSYHPYLEMYLVRNTINVMAQLIADAIML